MPKIVTTDPPANTKAHPRKPVNVASLKPAPYNPPDRTADRNIKDMVESLSRYGQFNDIIVTSGNMIIMGHRRVAAARRLGWRTLWATIRDDIDPDLMYAEDFNSTRKMSGRDALGVWIKNPRAVTNKRAKQFESMEMAIGRQRVILLYQSGYGYALYRRAVQIAGYCDREDDGPFVIKAVEWLLHHGLTAVAQQIMARGGSPAILRTAVDKNRLIKLDAALAD